MIPYRGGHAEHPRGGVSLAARASRGALGRVSRVYSRVATL
jgi:hypothetical protein